MHPGLRAVMCCVAFVLLSAPLVLAGEPETRALSMLAAQADTPRVAILGDSRPHGGVAPRVLTATFEGLGFPGVSAHNYAENGSDTLHQHAIAVTGLLRRPRPPAVIVWATNPLAFDGTRRNNRLDQLPPAVLPSLARAGAPVELLLDVATMAFFPPYRARPRVKQRIDLAAEKGAFFLARRQGILGLSFDVPPERRTYERLPDGQEPFVVHRDWEYGFDGSREGYTASYDKLALGDHHFRLAEEMADRAREAGSALVILELPVAPTYRRLFASRPVHLEWRERVARVAREHGAVWMSHADYSDDERAFGDPGHMQAPLAERYSRFLAATLSEHPRVRAALSMDR